MRKEKCQQIKTHVFENVAPLHQGKVSLNDVHRMFSHLGSRSEIEKCLNELVDDNMAQKVEMNQGTFYVFSEIALKYGQKWKDELQSLKEHMKNLDGEISSLEKKLEVNEKMMNIWLEGWKEALQDTNTYSCLNNYVSSVFFGQRIEVILNRLREKTKELREINMRAKEAERKIAASYNTP